MRVQVKQISKLGNASRDIISKNQEENAYRCWHCIMIKRKFHPHSQVKTVSLLDLV